VKIEHSIWLWTHYLTVVKWNSLPYNTLSDTERTTLQLLGEHSDTELTTLQLLGEHSDTELTDNDHVDWYFDTLKDYLIIVLRPAHEFLTYMETSPLPVKGCKI
jgi:hypothetical protein